MWIFVIAFIFGLLLSPWAGSFLLVLASNAGLQLLYSTIWSWGLWRIGIILASILGWALGKVYIVPLFDRWGIKNWVDTRILKPLVARGTAAVASNSAAVSATIADIERRWESAA